MLLLQGDCLEQLKSLNDGCVDALITDPPAGISFMGKSWDEDKGGRKQWVAWMTEVMSECLRVLKPGAHGLVWAIPRTSHWTATALEDAGFEIRDVVTHIFGSGFPKSMDISKAIDKQAGAERSRYSRPAFGDKFSDDAGTTYGTAISNIPSTPEAKQWQGWGTALKPASEHWILVRKPTSEKTVAANVLKHGVGGINIDASRISAGADLKPVFSGAKVDKQAEFGEGTVYGNSEKYESYVSPLGRFPANLVLSHNPDCVEVGVKKVKGTAPSGPNHGRAASLFNAGQGNNQITYASKDGTETVTAFECTPGCAVAALDAQSGILKSGALLAHHNRAKNSLYGGNSLLESKTINTSVTETNSGGASRFFYCAKASKKDKGADNTHPTVKSSTLMSYLIKLITPPGGVVLDPFMGSGSTGVSARKDGFTFVGIEKEDEYFAIAKARIESAA